jgi:hypothetical protein
LLYFLSRVSLYFWDGLDYDPPIYISYVSGLKGVNHTQLLLVEMGSLELFASTNQKRYALEVEDRKQEGSLFCTIVRTMKSSVEQNITELQ